MIKEQNTLDISSFDMKEIIALLQSQNEIIKDLQSKLEQSEKRYEQLMEQVQLARKKRFGASSEQSIYLQASLFDEVELYAQEQEVVETNTEATQIDSKDETAKRKKVASTPSKTCPDLEVVEIIHEPEDKDGYTLVGSQRKEILRFQPAKWFIEAHIYPTYKKELEDETTEFLQVEKIKSCIPNSFVSEEVLAYLMSQKFKMGLPLYRLEQDLTQKKVYLSRQTMSHWLITMSENMIEPLVERLKHQLLQQDIIHADETTVKVLRHQDGSENVKSYMWAYCSSAHDSDIRIFEYQPNRRAEHPQTFLEGYEGYLQTDGYSGYNNIRGITRIGCLAHARRKITDAIAGMAKGESQSKSIAEGILRKMNHIFSIDKKASALTLEQKQESRQELMQPAIDELKVALLDAQPKILENSNFGRAISYALNQYPTYENILLDARIEPSNNRAERMIKPFVIGRKAWLFSGTTRGAKASAAIYSIIQTAIANNLDVEKYLTYLFNEMKDIRVSSKDSLDCLLPTSDTLPQQLYVKKRNRT